MSTAHIPEFETTPQVLEKLMESGTLKTFPEGSVILNEHAHIHAIPLVIRGSIRVLRTDDEGREILLYTISAGESCIMSFLGGLHQDTSKVRAVADEETEILFVPVEKVNHLIHESPQWLDYIFRLYHKRFEELLEVVNAVAFKKMDERLFDYIRKKCELHHTNTLHLTHEHIAGELGTAREVVSRLLKQMESEGLVELGRNKILLKAGVKA